jgi:hypothetical protein
MWGLHLKKRGDWWHYYRAVPRRYKKVDQRKLIAFSPKTTDFSNAKLKAAEYTLKLEDEWKDKADRLATMEQGDEAEKFSKAAEFQIQNRFVPKPTQAISDEELLVCLRTLFAGDFQPVEQKSLLGIYEEPKLDLITAFDRFWDHIKEEWMVLSSDQIRTKRNVYLKSTVPGGVLMMAGTFWLAVLKLRAESRLSDASAWGGEMGFIAMLFFVSATGLALY